MQTAQPITQGGTRSMTVRRIREILGCTQTHLAATLGVSAKTVQSYEQGWRQVPVPTMIQLLVLLGLYREKTTGLSPCWEIKQCALDERTRCPAFTISGGRFCWFVAGRMCPARRETTHGEQELPCMSCEVVQALLWMPGQHPPEDKELGKQEN